MKLLVLSDLHYDFWNSAKRDPLVGLDETFAGLDHLILAGDITNKPKVRWKNAFARLTELIDPAKIHVFPGNHDYYSFDLDREERLAQIADEHGIHFCQKNVIDLGALRLICATLWTDYALGGNRLENEYFALGKIDTKKVNNDFRNIRLAHAGFRRIRPIDVEKVHADQKSWIESELAKPYEGKSVVVTHHAPHPSCLTLRREGDHLLSPGFASDLSDFILATRPDVWLHGHSHGNTEVTIGNTVIRNVSLGYPEEIIDPKTRIESLVLDTDTDPIFRGPANRTSPTASPSHMRTALQTSFAKASGLTDLLDKIETAGGQAHIVGGAIRNILRGREPKDFDLSTNLHPDTVVEHFTRLGHTVVPTGYEHGTVTVMAGAEGYEITTWRRDVETDGRRAVVAFADRIEDDATRRDFTVNALYADLDGQVIDPTGQGLADISQNRLRFIGSAETRIREDALRILRYYRFLATQGFDPEKTPPEDREALQSLTPLVDTLSRERVGMEMRKILGARDPVPTLTEMDRTGLLARALPGATLSDSMERLIKLETEHSHPADWETRLALLKPEAARAALVLSKSEAIRHGILTEGLTSKIHAREIGYRHGLEDGQAIGLLRQAVGIRDRYLIADEDIRTGAEVKLPIRGADFTHAFSGKDIGQAMKRAERDWIESGFTQSRDDLLAAHASPRASRTQGLER